MVVLFLLYGSERLGAPGKSLQSASRLSSPRRAFLRRLAGGQRPATDAAVKLNHVLPSQADASRGNEGVHRRGLMLAHGLAANHKAQPPLDLDCARKAYKLNSRCLAG